ncbi:spermatogenesis-associated protein 6 isoform X2 [Leptidea sinapis]|uniref:spermatogenesis-associated protein 6 isoform X2 n=1 Tax=Leptidea sinapis TaxID=189913 RepID=UPI0021C2CCA7|nr:spermatogenesis-associated protein 6 isoform X2 [Leptidea sinapis]
MPKVIEITIEIDIQKVSCPGVWLCQDGRVSLTVYALGTSYQTCLLPPTFPLMFQDIFYFKKRYQEGCALNNMCCLLKDETIYCELVQWCDDCTSSECVILAQYLGSLNDVLFPPNMCSNDGVDLLMRRSKNFPGILSPKIEIATKVRIDEVWSVSCNNMKSGQKQNKCTCRPPDNEPRQGQVCHSAQYHRNKCKKGRRRSGSRSRSRSGGSRSCCSLDNDAVTCQCPNPKAKSRANVYDNSARQGRAARKEYSVYNVETSGNLWGANPHDPASESSSFRASLEKDEEPLEVEENMQKNLLESCFIEPEPLYNRYTEKRRYTDKTSTCVCEICKRYYEIFHSNGNC